MTKMANAFYMNGFSVALVSFRGCNGEDNLLPGGYHVGFTHDLKLFLNTLHNRYPQRSIYLSGFSLGGNVILKCLGELGDSAAVLNIKGAAVTCVPFDPAACQRKLDVGFNRVVYSENFLRTLKQKAEEKIKKFPNSFDIEAVRKCNTIGTYVCTSILLI